MKKVALVVAALAVMCYAIPAFSAGTCQDWKGVWNFVYDNNTAVTICYDNSTDPITACDNDSLPNCNCIDINTPQLCVNTTTDPYSECDNASSPDCQCIDNPYYREPSVPGGTYEVKITSVLGVTTANGLTLSCIAQGKRTSDSQDIVIVQPDNATINAIPAWAKVEVGSYLYFEATYGTDNLTIKNFAQIPPADFTGDNFTARQDLNQAGLVSGTFTRALTCEDLDNCTTCELTVIPSTIGLIRKIVTFTEPFKVFVIRGTGDPAFERGDKATFDSDAIIPLLQLRLSKKTIIALTFVRPLKLFQLKDEEITVNVNDCAGTITVK